MQFIYAVVLNIFMNLAFIKYCQNKIMPHYSLNNESEIITYTNTYIYLYKNNFGN